MVSPLWSRTESTSKDLFDCSVNRFFVKGQESIYYTYNNGKLATDPKLACQNFINALERIPKVIESHEKEMAKVVANKDVLHQHCQQFLEKRGRASLTQK